MISIDHKHFGSTHQVPSDYELWRQVQDVLAYWGDRDSRLNECILKRKRPDTFLLFTPSYAVRAVEKRMEAIKDALEQLTFNHQVDVHLAAMTDPVKLRLLRSSGLLSSDIL